MYIYIYILYTYVHTILYYIILYYTIVYYIISSMIQHNINTTLYKFGRGSEKGEVLLGGVGTLFSWLSLLLCNIYK